MSFDPRSLRRPLEALHERESWRLDALRAELAEATRRHETDLAAHGQLEREHRAALSAAAPTLAAAIDPTLVRGRLLHLTAMRERLDAALGALGASERLRERLVGDSRKQHAKLESIGKHRDVVLREEAARAEVRRADESDRGWLASRHWHVESRPEASDE